MKAARKYVISGRVQGVGYRYFAERGAHELGICGYVKNCVNGNVEVYAIGDQKSLEEFKRLLTEGPRSARVAAVEEFEAAVDKQYNEFQIEGWW